MASHYFLAKQDVRLKLDKIVKSG